MGNRLPRGLGGRGHWLDMLGVGEEKVNVQGLNRIVGVTCMVRRRTARRIELDCWCKCRLNDNQRRSVMRCILMARKVANARSWVLTKRAVEMAIAPH